MHKTALKTGEYFFETYWLPGFESVLDIGSQDVNGTLREVKPAKSVYLGVDLAPGPGVDLVLKDPHRLPFDDASFDIIVSTSCLEHDPLFWLTFSEMLRVVRPGGLIYINAPSNGPYHGYPDDHWRFYPDCGRALAAWSQTLARPAVLVESFIGKKDLDVWADNVMVFARAPIPDALPAKRLCHQIEGATNIWLMGAQTMASVRCEPEDRIELMATTSRALELTEQLAKRDRRIAELVQEVKVLKAISDGMTPVAAREEKDQATRDRRSALPLEALATIQKGTLAYTYKGIPCLKNPFDFALYTKLLQETKPKTIIELGSHSGGSALWLADLLTTFDSDGHVYSIDIRPVANLQDRRITFLAGDVLHLEQVLPAGLLANLPRPLLVIEDTAHRYETTIAALRFFAPHLAPGEYILIEDGIVNDLAPIGYEEFMDGPNRAIFSFLKETGGRYAIDTDYCDYFGHNFTYNTNGYLRRVI